MLKAILRMKLDQLLGVYAPKAEELYVNYPLASKSIVCDGKLVDIIVENVVGFSDEQKEFFIATCNLLCEVINSDAFKNKFVQMKFRETNGFNNYQLYAMIISGMSGGEKVGDGALDIIYTLYGNEKVRKSTMGYSYKTRTGIWTDRYFVKRFMKEKHGKAYWCGHIFHELMHQLGTGFSHKIHKGSFVYEAGYLVRDVAVLMTK